MNTLNVGRQLGLDRALTSDVDLRELWLPVYKKRWNIILFTMFVAMLATLIAFSITPTYRATAVLQIENRPPAKIVSIDDMYSPDINSIGYLSTQIELLKSRGLMERVVTTLSLQENKEFDPRQQPKPLINWRQWLREFELTRLLPLTMPEDLKGELEQTGSDIFNAAVNSFSKTVVISPVRGTQLVEVGVDLRDPRTAQAAANKLVDAYIESLLDARFEMTETAASWMNERLGDLKAKLQVSEQRLQEYLDREGLVDLKGVTTITAEELSKTSDRLSDARREREVAESRYRQIQSLRYASWERVASLPFVMADPLVQQFRAQEAKVRSLIEELAQRYGPKHPKMIAARAELNAIIDSLRGQVEQIIAGIIKDYQRTVSNERALEGSLDSNKERIQEISRKEFRLQELQREVDTNRSLYEMFITRLKETSAISDLDVANARIVDRAILPQSPVAPNKKFIVLTSALAGALVAVAIAILSAIFKGTVETAEDIERNTGVSVIGLVPLVKNRFGRRILGLFLSDKDKFFSESFRSIRTNLMLAGFGKNRKVIGITSSVAEEGKSSVSANLAMAFGTMGKVLLIDADIRRPALSKGFKIEKNTPGLADVIAGSAELKECIRTVENISVMTVGTLSAAHQELLSSQRFSRVIEYLKDVYDYIIIDTPPILAVSDVLLISPQVDGLIYVVKAEDTSIRQIKRGIGRLLQNEVPVMGIVLNQVQLKQNYYEYYT